jgi:hypothetical protein
VIGTKAEKMGNEKVETIKNAKLLICSVGEEGK